MRILISNDDGITAPGIQTLARAFIRAGHEVAVFAPDSQRSAASHSLTLGRALTAKAKPIEGAALSYAVSGTPVDCVKLALHTLYTQAEFVVSGINHGYNLGTDVLYSGTVGAAMEAALCGVPSMAVSLAPQREDTYGLAADLAVELHALLAQNPLPKGMVLNLNYPGVDRALGVRAVPLKATRYVDRYVEHVDERGERRYTLTGGMDENQEPGEDDFTYLRRGYATVTALTADMTAARATEAFGRLLGERPGKMD